MSAVSLTKNFLFNASYQLLLIITPLITTPYLGRVLGAANVGVYSYTSSITCMFAIFAIMGMSSYGVRTIAKVSQDRAEVSRTFWNLYASQLTIGAVVFAAYLVYMFTAPQGGFVIAVIWSMWVLSELADVSWLLFGMQEFKIPTIRSFIVKLAELILIFTLVKGPDDLVIYIAILSAGYLANQLIIWPFVHNYVDFVKPTWEGMKVHYLPNLLLFIPVIAISLYTYIDKILLGSLSSMEQTGFFEYSEKMSKIPMALITALGTVMLPHMSNKFAAGEREEGKKLLTTSIWFMLAMAFAMMFGIMSISFEFAPVFFGEEFTPCVPLMIVLALIIPIISTTNMIGRQFLLPDMKDKLFTASVCIGAVVNVTSNLILIPHFAALGAAISTVLAEVSVLVVQAWFVRNELPLGLYAKNAVPFFVIGAIMAFVVRASAALFNSLWGVGALGLVLEILVGALFFTVAAVLWCKKTDNEIFRNLLERRRAEFSLSGSSNTARKAGKVRTFFSRIGNSMNCSTAIRAAYKNHGTILFLMAYLLWLVFAILMKSLYSVSLTPEVMKVVRLSVIAILLVREIAMNSREDALVSLVIIVGITAIIRVFSGTFTLLYPVLLVYCARDVDFRIIAKATIVTTVLVSLFIVLSSLTGVITDYIWDPTTRRRHGLGFLYTTFASHFFLNVAILYVVVRKDKISFAEMIAIAAIAYGIFVLTDSKNSFILVLGLLLGAFVLKYWKLRSDYGKSLLRLLSFWPYVVLPVFFFVICWFYNPDSEFMYDLNKFFTNRLVQTNASFAHYGIHPFGQEVVLTGNGFNESGVLAWIAGGTDYNFIDCGYIYVMFHYGYVIFFVALYLFLRAGWKIAAPQNRFLCLGLFVVALHSMVDTQWLMLEYTTLLFLLCGNRGEPPEPEPVVFSRIGLRRGDLSDEYAVYGSTSQNGSKSA